VALDRLWAGWRGEYVAGTVDPPGDGCVLCRILAGGPEEDEQRGVVWRDDRCAVVLNAYPYTSGHLMVMPLRHVAELEEATAEEAGRLWAALADAVRALKQAYAPDGINVGVNLGRSAGAGVPGHFHIHCVPRWDGDTNFMTALAETRVLPESLPTTFAKLRAAWPNR
jgi:diadenosine tetraphosphate (Ap4A) HIT family hydrolase